MGITEMATRLNAEGTAPPQGERWTKSVIYNLKLRLSWITPRPWNVRPHTDEEVKERMLELRSRGHTYLQIASILNTQGWLPRKGQRFTPRSVRQLLGQTRGLQLLSPRKYLENLLERMELAHQKVSPGQPFQWPGYARLATLLTEAGYITPRGYARWWPAQVQQLLGGASSATTLRGPSAQAKPAQSSLDRDRSLSGAKRPRRVDEVEAALGATAS
jgi:hypothetical protein